jgi:hypothetical protein
VPRRRKSKTSSPTQASSSGAVGQPTADVERAATAIGAVGQQLASTPWWQYRQLDRQHRSRTWSNPDWFPDWHWIQPDDVARIAERSGQPVTAAGLLSMHPSGYVREAAVRVLAQNGRSDALPFLIVRAADWVEQVRQPAQHAVDGLVRTAGSDDLLRAAALLDTMTTEDARASGFSQALRRQVVTRVETPALLAALTHPDLHVRRLVAEIIVERRAAESALDLALHQRDVVTARIVGVAALDQLADPDVVLAKLRASRIASLRALALFRYQSTNAPNAVAESEAGLLDRAPSVRFLAQRHLADTGVDVRGAYVDALPSGPIAVQGLAEVGGADDVELITPYLADRRPRMRVAAVLAIGRLLGSKGRTTMLTTLDDPSPSVVRAAGLVLARQQLTTAELDDLWRRATDPAAPPALKRAVFVVVGQQGRWPRLVLACRAIAGADDELREQGRLMLDSVFSSWNRSSTDPTAGQLDELRARGPAAAGRVGSAPVAGELLDVLKQYGIDRS